MYKNILLSVDLGHKSSWEKALPQAVELCQASGATLHVLTVVPDFGMTIVGQYFPKGYEKDVAGKVLDALKTFVADNVPKGVTVQHCVGEGVVYETILKLAREVGADLIVVGAGRPDLKEYLLGPNAARVARHADMSVLIVR
jgi:nucleotide-binding universal stress UspA family protein